MPEESVIKLKRTDVSDRMPPLSALALGELALNIADGKIFLKDTNNQIISFHNNNYYEDVTTLVRSNSAAWTGGVGNINVTLNSASWKTDYQGNSTYIGKALPNTPENSSSWYIKKITTNELGQVVSSATTSNAPWTDRLNIQYS